MLMSARLIRLGIKDINPRNAEANSVSMIQVLLLPDPSRALPHIQQTSKTASGC
jgi:hypothetical protein